jgi:ribonuclease VapC
MVVDSSAVISAIVGEDDADRIRSAMLSAGELRMSAVNLLECRIVLRRRFAAAASVAFEEWLSRASVVIDPFDDIQSTAAADAHARYGKGSGHAAQLNLGDCAAYALAKSKDLPLLFKGDDFALTDVRSALA